MTACMEIWSPTQQPDRGLAMVAKCGRRAGRQGRHPPDPRRRRLRAAADERLYDARPPPSRMKVNTPVKLQWTREDDFAHDFYPSRRLPPVQGRRRQGRQAGRLAGAFHHLHRRRQDRSVGRQPHRQPAELDPGAQCAPRHIHDAAGDPDRPVARAARQCPGLRRSKASCMNWRWRRTATMSSSCWMR